MTTIGFIIPTVGRPTLARTIDSLFRQTSPDWRAVVVFDGTDPNYETADPRVVVLRTPEKLGTANHAAHVRNYGAREIDSEWVGFVDDDDTLVEDYVERALEAIRADAEMDVLIFRMRYDSGLVLPPVGWDHFEIQKVGISFCLRRDVLLRNPFEPSGEEDFYLLDRCRSDGLRIVLSPHIAYLVRPPS